MITIDITLKSVKIKVDWRAINRRKVLRWGRTREESVNLWFHLEILNLVHPPYEFQRTTRLAVMSHHFYN